MMKAKRSTLSGLLCSAPAGCGITSLAPVSACTFCIRSLAAGLAGSNLERRCRLIGRVGQLVGIEIEATQHKIRIGRRLQFQGHVGLVSRGIRSAGALANLGKTGVCLGRIMSALTAD